MKAFISTMTVTPKLVDDELEGASLFGPPSYASLSHQENDSYARPEPSKTEKLDPSHPSSSHPSPASYHDDPSPSAHTYASSSNTLDLSLAKSTKAKSSFRWFPFGLSRTAKQVRATIQDIVRSIVLNSPSSECVSVLHSCSDTCAEHGLDLSSILQEPFIEAHTPVYWAIVRRPVTSVGSTSSRHELDAEVDALPMALLTLSKPITAQTISDVRSACTSASDNAFFQRIRRQFTAFESLSGADEMILGRHGESEARDVVDVEELSEDAIGFTAAIELAHFHTRMRVSKAIKVDFIARGAL